MRLFSLQKVLGIACIPLLAYAMWLSGSIGFSRLYSEYAVVINSVKLAEKAITITPNDPHAHFALASAQAEKENLSEAIREYERAIQLKPRDYYLWLRLGRAHDWSDNEQAARNAFKAAIQLAPFYAPPHWELGNLLLRAGDQQQAFKELNRAAESNASLLPAVIDLAWGTFDGDKEMIQSAVNSNSAYAKLALARYFAQRERLADALSFLDAANSALAETERMILLRKYFDQKRYHEAYQVWASRPEALQAKQNGNSVPMTDSSFEGQLSFDKEAWFGWHLSNDVSTNVKVALDPNNPREGMRSLRLEWSGDPNPTTAVISQLIVVEPGQNYTLSFSARSESLVSGGMPFIGVAESLNTHGQMLAMSQIFNRDSTGWRDYSFDFSTPASANAIVIFLRRQCATSPCPIYGHLWLDNFSLNKK